MSARVSRRRRIVKLRRHDVKGKAKRMFWCSYCWRYTYNLETHRCGERQS